MTPVDFCHWLASLDDPEDPVGREQRRTVTLTQIIDRARAAVATQPEDCQSGSYRDGYQAGYVDGHRDATK